MNVLLLFDGYVGQDDRLRLGFARRLEEVCHIRSYGPNMINDLLPYDEKITGKEIIDVIKPDVLLLLMYSSDCYDWLPEDILHQGVPSALREEDHYEKRFNNLVYKDLEMLDWYKEMGFTLLLRRHYYKEEASIPSVWLPPSADDTYLHCRNSCPKTFKIGFAGSFESHQAYYDIRRLAILKLKNANLLAERSGKIWDGYDSYLRSYVGYLACAGGFLHTPLAKTFEIPLSGGALLTNYIEKTELLFGDKKCYYEYKDDCSDIGEVAIELLTDNRQREEVRSNALEVVEKKHTDTVRIQELYNILDSLIKGKEIPRIWGQ